jgi:hypothetical protein
MKLREISTIELRRLIRASEAELGPQARTAAILRRELARRNSKAARKPAKAVSRGE